MSTSRQPINAIDDIIINRFKSALSSRQSTAIATMWKKNPPLQAWFSGKPVYFGTDQPDMRIISFDHLIENFRSALSSQCKQVTKEIWKENFLLQAWFSGKPVNFGTAQSPDVRVILFDDLIKNFKLALSCRSSEVIIAMWKENSLLRAWFRGEPVNFGTHNAPDMRTIPLDDLIVSFKSALWSRNARIIKMIWVESSLLRAWFNGKPVNFGTHNAPDIRTASFNECIDYFTWTLSSQCNYIIKQIWNDNSLLNAWLSNKPVNFGTHNAKNIRIIPLNDLANHFKLALVSRSPDIIAAMWEENPLLRAWFRGEPVNFGTHQEPDIRAISFNDLIDNLESIISSQNPNSMEAMLDENTRLNNVFQTLDFNRSTKLLKKLLSNDRKIHNELTSHIINQIDNAELIHDVLNAMKNKQNKTPYKNKKITLLNTRLAELISHSNDNPIEMTSAAVTANNENIVAQNTTPLRKRKALSTQITYGKNARSKSTPQKTDNLVRQSPSPEQSTTRQPDFSSTQSEIIETTNQQPVYQPFLGTPTLSSLFQNTHSFTIDTLQQELNNAPASGEYKIDLSNRDILEKTSTKQRTDLLLERTPSLINNTSDVSLLQPPPIQIALSSQTAHAVSPSTSPFTLFGYDHNTIQTNNSSVTPYDDLLLTEMDNETNNEYLKMTDPRN